MSDLQNDSWEWKPLKIDENVIVCKDTKEKVNHPDHYGGRDNPYEAIKVIEAWKLDFHLGNTVKYISRAGKKEDELEDLKKAAWYLKRKIDQLEKEVAKHVIY